MFLKWVDTEQPVFVNINKVVYDALLCSLIHSSLRAQRRHSSASFLKATSVLKHTDEQNKINNNFAFGNYEKFGHKIINANDKKCFLSWMKIFAQV